MPRVVADPAPIVLLSAFASDGLELTLAFWIADPHNGQGNVRSLVNLAVLHVLNEAGVEIPFPQRVVHGWPAGLPGTGAVVGVEGQTRPVDAGNNTGSPCQSELP